VSDPIQTHPLSTNLRWNAGRFVFCSQFRVHNRCPIQARARPERDDRRLHADPHPRREQFPLPDANSGSVTWTGPPPEIVTVQSLLYASLATSLFAPFLAMLGKQWVNRYLRNRGGSAADKNRDRQRKLDGLEKWRFHLTIESLPVMLQLALLLLGCALSLYLWTISRAAAGVTIAVTLFGVTLYVFLILAATLYYNCPYQTPPSILTRTIIRYLSDSDAAFARSLRSLIPAFLSIKNLGRIFRHLRSGVRCALASFHWISTMRVLRVEWGMFKKPAPALWVTPRLDSRHFTDLRISQVHRLRRLYQLFEYDSTAWEAVVVKEVDEEMDASRGYRTTPVLPADWACDYPGGDSSTSDVSNYGHARLCASLLKCDYLVRVSDVGGVALGFGFGEGV